MWGGVVVYLSRIARDIKYNEIRLFRYIVGGEFIQSKMGKLGTLWFSPRGPSLAPSETKASEAAYKPLVRPELDHAPSLKPLHSFKQVKLRRYRGLLPVGLAGVGETAVMSARCCMNWNGQYWKPGDNRPLAFF